jgi:Lrp/AsnC family transcriptional regulator for asnA, asnC and gidA
MRSRVESTDRKDRLGSAPRVRARNTQSQGHSKLTVLDLDPLDRRIIAQLQDNGRRSNAAIARTVGVTETTIRNRIERLVANGFIRITAVIDPRRTPYQVDALIWMRLDRGRKAARAAERIAELPNVVYAAYTSGRYDLLIEALFQSDTALFEFLSSPFLASQGIAHSETCHVLRTVKINYDWKLPLTHAIATAGVGAPRGGARPTAGVAQGAAAVDGQPRGVSRRRPPTPSGG